MNESVKSTLKLLEVRINQMTKYSEMLGNEDEKTKTSITICTYILDSLHPEWKLKKGLKLSDKRPLLNMIYSFNTGIGIAGSLRWFREALNEEGIPQ